jgi:hypothetical protein
MQKLRFWIEVLIPVWILGTGSEGVKMGSKGLKFPGLEFQSSSFKVFAGLEALGSEVIDFSV